MRNAFFSMLIVITTMVLSGCATMQGDWSNAQRTGTITAYEEFLRRYPQGEFSEQAQTALESLYFEEAKNNNTIKAYDEFLLRYPQGKLSEQAQSAIESLSFSEAQNTNTVEAYENFLQRYPQGDFSDTARLKMARLSEMSYGGKTVTQWIKVLSSKDQNMESEAVFALARIGPPAWEAVPALIDCFKSNTRVLQETASWPPQIVIGIRQTTTQILARIASALGSIGPQAKDAVPILIQAVGSKDPDISHSATDALRKIAGN